MKPVDGFDRVAFQVRKFAIDRQAELAMKRADTANVIAMFMRHNHSSAVANVVTELGQTRLRFTATDTCVKQQARIAASNEHAVAGTS